MTDKKDLPVRKPNRLTAFDYSKNGAYFITICTKDRKCILSNIVGEGLRALPKIELTTIGKEIVDSIKYINENYENIFIDNYVVMPNHIHLIVVIDNKTGGHGGPPLQKIIGQIKSYTTNKYGMILWQRSYYDHIIRDEEDYINICEYINNNALKWQDDKYFNGGTIMADIHSFESMAALDGDGIRYAIFFTGCPLRCAYCHNPDTWYKSGNEWSAEKLVNKIKRYKPYFKNGGGVTFSGGEPLLNAKFINETAPLLKAEGINYAIDTSGSVPLTDDVKTALNGADLVILDLKFYEPESYKKYTKGNFNNFVEIGKYCTEKGIRLWLRTVVVPNINDNEESISKYAEFAKQFKFEKYELLAFHTMGFFKYENLGDENPLKDTPPLDKNRLDELQKFLNKKLSR